MGDDDEINRGLDALGYDEHGHYDPKRDPTYVHDRVVAEARRQLDAGKGTGGQAKPEFPGEGADHPTCFRWLHWAASVPEGSRFGEPIRYGGTKRTPMVLPVIPPGNGQPRRVRFEEERDAEKPGTLRAALIRDGGLRAEHITGNKIAGDFYWVLCQVARVVGAINPLDELREQLDGYRLEARRETHAFGKGDLYGTLDALRRYPYSKRQINQWLAALEHLAPGQHPPPPPRPPLFVDDRDAGEW